tara:strand:+ start:14148 stop:16490 length:2343 start_codon:yes stop_codon:yes gene_type:complete
VGDATHTLRIPFEYEDGDYRTLEGHQLVKVILEKPTDMYEAKKTWKKTYEADIPIHYRYCIDRMKEIPEMDLLKWYIDCEWIPDNSGEHSNRMTSICIKDSFTNEYTMWAWFPHGHTITTGLQTLGEDCKLKQFDSEAKMLATFAEDLGNSSVDMLIGWYILGADIPQIIKRMEANGLNPNTLSPYGEVKGVNRVGMVFGTVDNYATVAQPIKGITTLNLDFAFERQWADEQQGDLPSTALDFVSNLLFDEGKQVSERFPDPEDFYRRAWLEDTECYLSYLKKDVELTARIDESRYISESVLALQKLLVAPFDACFFVSNMGQVYFSRHADWVVPTKTYIDKDDKKKYEGAMIFNPSIEGTAGLWLNIASFDFAGLYPAMIVRNNIDWKTKTKETENVFRINIKTPRTIWGEITEEEYINFSKDEVGLLPRCILELKSLRDSYKAKMKRAETQQEYNKWNANQMAVKRLSASFYGILGLQGYGWGDIDLAASITASARHATRSAALKVKEMGYEICYGHTDSIYIKIESVDKAKEVCSIINEFIQTEIYPNDMGLEEHPVVLEFEKHYRSLGVGTVMNRNAGFIQWKEGLGYLSEPEFFATGFVMKRRKESELAKEVQSTVLKMWVSEALEEEVVKFCQDKYNMVKEGQTPIEYFIKRGRLRKDLVKGYKSWKDGVAGLVYYNTHINPRNPVLADSFYFTRISGVKGLPTEFTLPNGSIRKATYVSVRNLEEIDERFIIDYDAIAEAEVVAKAKPIFDAMNWDLNQISSKGRQLRLDEWF